MIEPHIPFSSILEYMCHLRIFPVLVYLVKQANLDIEPSKSILIENPKNLELERYHCWCIFVFSALIDCFYSFIELVFSSFHRDILHVKKFPQSGCGGFFPLEQHSRGKLNELFYLWTNLKISTTVYLKEKERRILKTLAFF